MTTDLHIGTSGWIYRHWRGRFYPEGMPPGAALEFYARQLDTVEVNYSFYRLPSREAFTAWREQTPASFCFAVKGSRFVTHLKHLREPGEHVARFFERATALGDKLGPVLWQLPPRFHRDDARLADFLASLPPGSANAVEFRDPTWLADPVYALLSRYRAALCLADRDGASLPPTPILTADWTYLRFHSGLAGGDYTEEQLRHWAAVVADFRARGVRVFAYFNNDWGGFALTNAERLKALTSDTTGRS